MLLRLVCFFLLLAGTSVWGQDIDPSLLKRFLEAVPQTTKIVERISVRVRWVSTVDFVVNSKAGEAELRAAGVDPSQKEVGETAQVAIRGPWGLQVGTTRNGEYVAAKNGEYAFRINRNAQLKSYSVEFLEQLGVDPVSDQRIQATDDAARFFVLANWNIAMQPLSRLIKSPFFKIHRISAVPSDTGELVRIEFDHLIDDPKRKKERFSDAYMLCDPGNGWALKEYGETAFHGGTNRLIIDFGERVNGFPIPKRVTSLYSLPKESEVTRRTVTTIEVMSQDVPKEEFYLSHYGLPEPKFQRASLRRWVWYLSAGVVCLGVAAIIVKRQRARLA
jgi:hypothetical protein